MANESASATATLQIPLNDGVQGQEILCTWSLTTPVELQNYIVMVSGFNLIRPTIVGSVYQLLVIVPPPGIYDTWTLKGVNGDTGFQIGCGFPTILPSPSTSNIGITATTGGYTILTRWFR